MRNVRVMNIPVGVLAAWILVLGYVLWAVEAFVAKPASGKQPCSATMIEMSNGNASQGSANNNS